MSTVAQTTYSNHFGVKDLEAFKTWAEGLGLAIREHDDGVSIQEQHELGWPQLDPNTLEKIDFYSQLAPHLTSVALLVEVSTNSLESYTTYAGADAYAISPEGEIVVLATTGIEGIAQDSFPEYDVCPL